MSVMTQRVLEPQCWRFAFVSFRVTGQRGNIYSCDWKYGQVLMGQAKQDFRPIGRNNTNL